MDFSIVIGDSYDFVPLGKKPDLENITPHKIAVVAFIREYCLLKYEKNTGLLFNPALTPKYRKDFCMLVLKLIQCPDLEFKELELLFTSGKYNLLNAHLRRFCDRLKQIHEDGVGAFMECVQEAQDKLMLESHGTAVIISKSSVLGLYLRRISLSLDRLSFSEVIASYEAFCKYYEMGRPGILLRNLSKDKINVCETLVTDSPLHPAEKHLQQRIENSRKKMNFDTGSESCQWSRKQAELFVAQQATLLQINEPQAMSPSQLQNTINQILNDNPDLPEVHYLSFLNCLRVNEFCGAQDALYSCFDRSAGTASVIENARNNSSTIERNKGFRYAALNLAILHAHFNQRELAMSALREAMIMSLEARDAAALQHVQAWLVRCAGGGRRGGRRELLFRAAEPPAAPGGSGNSTGGSNAQAASHIVPHRTAVAAQALAQHIAVNVTRPSHIFLLMMKYDIIHCQHSMADLLMMSLANRAALWFMYGKTEMGSVFCQLLLSLNTKWVGAGSLCAAGTAQRLWLGGSVAAARAVLAYSRRHFPDPPLARPWMRTECIITCMQSLYRGKWQEAEQAINQLASLDRWESQLLKSELYFYKGEPTYALGCLNDVLDFCNGEDDDELYNTLRVRAMIMKAQILNSSSGIHLTSSISVSILNEALTIASENYLEYQAALVEMQVANIQLQLECVSNAFSIVKRVLPSIMAHGGVFDMARGLLLYIKCRIACAPSNGEKRTRVIKGCLEMLQEVKSNFNKIDAISRLKDVLYLQAQLYNEIGNLCARNKCAFEYRQLDEQQPFVISNTLLTCF